MAEGNKNALPFGLCAKYKIELPDEKPLSKWSKQEIVDEIKRTTGVDASKLTAEAVKIFELCRLASYGKILQSHRLL